MFLNLLAAVEIQKILQGDMMWCLQWPFAVVNLGNMGLSLGFEQWECCTY